MLSASASYSTKPKVFIVLPAFNEAENLKLLLPDLRATLLQQHLHFELVVVNDGSQDETELFIKSEMNKDSKIKLLS